MGANTSAYNRAWHLANWAKRKHPCFRCGVPAQGRLCRACSTKLRVQTDGRGIGSYADVIEGGVIG